MKPKYYKYQAEIVHKQKIIKIYKQILEGNNIKFLKQLSKELVNVIPITIEIPKEKYISVTNHSDFTAFQSDDRFWSTETIAERYNTNICKLLCSIALIGYNIEPIKI